MAPTFLALLAQQLHALLRDKGVALLVVGAPVLYGFFYPWFYATQVAQRVPVAVVVQDSSSLGRQMLRFAQASPRIDPRLVTGDEAEAQAALLRGAHHVLNLLMPYLEASQRAHLLTLASAYQTPSATP